MSISARNSGIHLYTDTGGTFTDTIAADSDGNIINRVKVLSNSALRGSGKRIDSSTIEIKLHENVDPSDHFFVGYQLRLTGILDQTFDVTHSKKNRLSVESLLPDELSSDKPFPVEIQSPEEAPILAARLITNTPLKESLPPLQLRLSTTKGTNALLERQGAKTLFLITEGFQDLLRIKNQQRPNLFSLNIDKPEPFASHIIEVPERLDSKGNILKKLDLDKLKKRLDSIPSDIEAAGICLMHSYLNPHHEKEVEKLLREMGFEFISRSSNLSATIKIVPRAVTTDINSYLTPVMQKYLDKISAVAENTTLRVMGSAGSLIDVNHYKPKDGLLSGPAGGVIGAAAIGERNGYSKIISFDMGGTSTDVSRYEGQMDYIFEHSVGDATLSSPAIEIETVAAGGGSICDFDGKSLTVGPESAGADPGPACYGQGGPLTITDVNLLTGRLDPSNFHITIDPDASKKAFEKLIDKMKEADGSQEINRNKILEGFLDIANERMAQAIHKISIEKGFDPSEYVMIAFGGAGAQHALSVAAKLNITKVLVPSDAGLLSAYGLQQARIEEITSRQILKPLTQVSGSLNDWLNELTEEATQKIKEQGLSEDQIEISRRILFLRLKGQDTSLEIDGANLENLEGRFQEEYKQQYGHWVENREIELEAIRVIASEIKSDQKVDNTFSSEKEKSAAISPFKESGIIHNGEAQTASVYRKESLKPGMNLKGPALILDPHSTTVIEPGWKGIYRADGTWQFEQISQSGIKSDYEKSESINLQLYTNRFTSVADQMGEMLRRTAISVNVKERLDFSCALLDANGYLVVNAPHIPVHLGAMGTCVRTLIRDLQSFQNFGGLAEGDVIVTNHPGFGGSHLPDVTVVTPVFVDGERIGFTASRAHHAEIGGKQPGSMPPDANNLAEEGVVIPPTQIAKDGEYDWSTLENLLKENPYPTRSFDENMADIRAAVAANYRGAEELKKLVKNYGKIEVLRYMDKLKSYASERMKSTLKNIEDGVYQATEQLDDKSELSVKCMVSGSSLSIDFEGTSGVHPGNLNANPSIVNSVIIYVLRLLIDEPLPLNDGLLEPVEITIPRGMLNPEFPSDPTKCPAVVGGNIETSQRLTDTLLKAFNMAACSYGTMNNVLFGNDSFGYYETVAGGTGAGNGFHGADAVHQHMTNTRATDPEILEHRYPVILNRYQIRKKSGGNGKWKGGNGIIREMKFTEPVTLSVLTQHRTVPPYGLERW
ncbi:MAG: hydantoinase B/oxoprolinase family protein [Balneolaceae bacterium]|nr:hydantoinase B/oxoprolinase family protein [Balneolaceae bacterium]